MGVDFHQVRAEGLEGLSIDEKNQYVADPSGFIRSVSTAVY